MKRILFIILVLIAFGCAKVSVETAKPIKVDINMRVDIYQHVVQDVESINDEIYGSQEKKLNSIFMVRNAYAADWSGQAQEAISRRKTRVAKIEKYFAKGYIGENKDALLEIKGNVPSQLRGELVNLIKEENKDREIIYKETAQKNNASISEVRKVFFGGDYKRAPSGYYFEVYDSNEGKYVWIRK
jgi:uncharacterized protein YdbL (DUF1318 family)